MKRNHHVYIAQSPEYAQLLHILTAPGAGGALILGGHGIGKTTLVRAVFAHEDVSAPVMRVHCSPTLAGEPCGALSPYLSADTPTDSPAHVLREITGFLATGSKQGATPIVVVEDAEYLDAETAFILSTLVENAAIKLVAIGHGRADGGSPLLSLAETGLIAVLSVQPLGLVGVRYLAEQLAGGSFTEAAIEVIAEMTGGNPSFVEAFMESCAQQGLIVADPSPDGTSRLLTLARLAPEPDDLTIELVRDVMRAFPSEHQEILELIALAGPRTARELSAFSGGEYRRLIESGILTAGTDDRIRITSHIHAIVLRSIVPPGRSAALYAAWSERVKTSARPGPFEVLWALEVSAESSAEQVLAAIEQANNDHKFPLAWRLADAEESEDCDLAILLRARTLMGLGRNHSARTMLLSLARSTTDPVLLHRAHIFLSIVSDKIEIAEEHERVGHTPHEAVSDYFVGPRTKTEAERILDDPTQSDDQRVMALLALADIHSIAGRTVTALHFAQEALDLIAGDDRMRADYELPVQFRIGWNLVFTGRYSDAEQLCSSLKDLPLSIAKDRAGTMGIVRALAEFLRGQTTRARRTLDEAVAELRLHGMPRFLTIALALRALVGTDNVVPQRKSEWAKGLRNIEARPGWILAQTALAAAANDSLASFPLIERELLAGLGCGIYDPTSGGHASRLAALAGDMEGSRAALLLRLAEIFTDTQPEAAEALARDASQVGEWAIACQGFARAATLWAEAGDDRLCGAALRQLRELVKNNEVTPDAYTTRALALAELTRREEEIVDLTRSGKTNAEIARVLTVSQRTVEGHLYRIFSKLGITERSHLNSVPTDPGTSPI